MLLNMKKKLLKSTNENSSKVAPLYNDKIFNDTEKNMDNINNNTISSLSGNTMSIEEFKHNNMEPFYSGSSPPGSNMYNKEQLLDRFTGNDDLTLKNKKEQSPLFSVTKENIYNETKDTEFFKERMDKGNFKSNELPFDKMNVGPGLNKGYTTEGSGGFHNRDTRDYVLPKNVDELRVLSNPKQTFDGVTLDGKSQIDQRGKIGDVNKYRPDTFFINSHERLNTTIGICEREEQRPLIIVKDTNRKDSKSLLGHAGYKVEKYKLNPKIKKSFRNNYENDWKRNVSNSDEWGNMEINDYGKSGIELPCNERDVTTNRTHILNPQSIIKELISPLMDIAKKTRKENVIGNIRQSGNVCITLPNTYVYDPNDVAKTTLKETNIYNKYVGIVGNENLQGADGYLISSADAPNTNRQFTEDLREPTQVKEKLYNGGDKVNINIKKNECDYISDENQSKRVNKVYDSRREVNECEITQTKDTLDNEHIYVRNNEDIVEAFKNNPYTQSLNSFA